MAVVKKLLRIVFAVVLAVIVLLLVGVLIYTAPYWWKHFVTYPRLEKEQAGLLAKRRTPEKYIRLHDYQGVLHVHSYWSHDSRGVLEEILPAAKKAGLDFIFFSDHPHAKLDTFPRSYSGMFDGVLFEPGSESGGMLVFPLDTVVLDWREDRDTFIKQVVENGGLVLYSHTEEPHDWSNPDYQGMEIYNIHTDFLDEDSILPIMINTAINGKKYRRWVYREIYDDQTKIWANWDSLNSHRRIVGMAAVDAHNNQNFRARYTPDGLVEWVGPNAKTIRVARAGWKEKLLLGKPDAAGWAFKWEVDTYFGSFNFVNTHIFGNRLTGKALKDNLVKGHAYISFTSLADARGFQFFSVDDGDNITAIMGDSVSADRVQALRAISPLPVQFQLIRNGKVIDSVPNVYDYTFKPQMSPGVYRIVALLYFDEQWTPWVLTNPIYIVP